MSITSLGSGLAPLSQTTPQAASSAQTTAPSRQIQQERPHHAHGQGGGKPPTPTTASTDSDSLTSTSTTGTTLNSLA